MSGQGDRNQLIADLQKRRKEYEDVKARSDALLKDKEAKKKKLDQTDNYLKNIESIGQPIGEVL